MGKLYARSAKGRTAILPSPTRGPRSRGTTSRGNTGAKTKDSGPWTSPPTKQPSRVTKNRAPTTRRRQIPSNTQDESYGSGKEDASESAEDADDDDDEEDEDDEDPNVFAPSHAYLAHQTGPQNPNPHNEEALFGSSDDEDDDVYEAVNDVSDSEDDGGDERVESYVVEDIMAEGLSDLEAEDMAILDLDHFEGMTEWGFGGDLDTFEAQTPFSDDSESTMTEAVAERHVHWGNDVEPSNILGGLVSPLLTRALLPSARPIEAGTTGNDFVADMTARTEQPTTSLRHGAFEEYDTDATDEDLPAEAYLTTPKALHQIFLESAAEKPPSSPPSGKKGKKFKPRHRGPRRGSFTVDKDKPWGVYDREGNKVLMMPAPDTDRHDWLEGVTGKNISASASPNTSFAQLLDDSDGSVTSSQERHETIMNGASPDVMLAGLNSAPDNEADRGHTTGPAEAFYPPLGFQVAGDYIVGPEDGGNIFDDDDIDEGDLPGDIGNFIEFDGEDSSDGEIYMPADINEIGGARNVDEMFPHLNNRNVTAFRQSADPARAALNGRPALPNIDTTQPSSPGPSTPLHGRKRKAPSIPYKGEHYEGTTPVHRTIISTTKRRKVTT